MEKFLIDLEAGKFEELSKDNRGQLKRGVKFHKKLHEIAWPFNKVPKKPTP